jgi:diguanylate cyclase (GGDEF)-like protein
VVFGRDADCTVPLDDDTVSRRHAVVRWTGEAHEIEDLGSTNGTYLNRKAVQKSGIAHGDELKIGRRIFKFLCAGTAEGQYHEVSYRLMTRDGLTGAWNRHAFDESYAREISRARRYERPLALISFDIDHFKRVNDTAGHMAGDELLRQLAELVGASVRKEDLFARIGGEEFAVLMPEGTLESARATAERLREQLGRTEFDILGASLRVTASFGAAALDHATDLTGEKLRREADERLYAAKAAGRDRVVAG